MKAVQIDLLDVLVDRHDRCILEYSANAHGHTVGHGEKSLPHFRVPQRGGPAKRKQRSIAHQQLVKIGIVLPGGELEGFKAGRQVVRRLAGRFWLPASPRRRSVFAGRLPGSGYS